MLYIYYLIYFSNLYIPTNLSLKCVEIQIVSRHTFLWTKPILQITSNWEEQYPNVEKAILWKRNFVKNCARLLNYKLSNTCLIQYLREFNFWKLVNLPRSIQKTAKIYSETAKIYSVYQAASRNSIWKNHSKKPKKCVSLKDPWRMNDHLNCKIQLVLHIFGLLKQNRIKSSLLNLLSFISVLIFCMQYSTVAPWVSSALALINSITLGWLAWCQHSNLVFLNQALVDLCQRLPHPGNEEDLHQDWKPL